MKFLLLLLIIPCFTFAQNKVNQNLWRLTVVDSIAGKGIVKATVAINNKHYYTTDNNGVVIIGKTLITPGYSFIISCIGYKRMVILPLANYQYPDTIKLSDSVMYLNEVKISASGLLATHIGDIKQTYKTHSITQPKSAYAQFIPNDKNITGTISSVEFVVNNELHGIEMPFRVRLYTKNKDTITLGTELTTDSIVVYNPQKKQLISIDITKYNIQLPPNGVIVVFETLSPSYYSKETVWYEGQNYIKTPGIDMDQTKNYWNIDSTKHNRSDPYSMVGPQADKWNLDDVYDQWYVYKEGNNFAITITVVP